MVSIDIRKWSYTPEMVKDPIVKENSLFLFLFSGLASWLIWKTVNILVFTEQDVYLLSHLSMELYLWLRIVSN